MKGDEEHYVESFSDQLLDDIEEGRNDSAINALQNDNNLHKVTDNLGATLLHCASYWGNDVIVRHLIQMGAEVNAKDQHERTPLMLTIPNKHTSTMEILLEAGAHIFITNGAGYSSLEMAVSDEDANWNVAKIFLNIVEKLYKNAKDIAMTLYHARCHLDFVISWDKPCVAKYLLGSKCLMESRYSKTDIRNALSVAIRERNVKGVKFLLDHGADINAADDDGHTPFTTFMTFDDSEENLDVLRLLVSQRPDIYQTDGYGKTSMRDIFKYGAPEVVLVFLQDFIDFSRTDLLGSTPLHYLVQNDSFILFVDELEKIELDVDILDNSERSPLHLAADVGNPMSIAFLLENGANVNAKDIDNYPPIYYAITSADNLYNESATMMHWRCVDLLLKNGAHLHFQTNPTQTFVDWIIETENDMLVKSIFMYLTMNEAIGKPIAKLILDKTNSYPSFKKLLKVYRRKVRHMQAITVYGSLTLFKLLTASHRNLLQYLRNPYTIYRMIRINENYTFDNDCFELLRERVEKAIRTVQLREQAAVVISRLTNLNKGSYSSILDRTIDYLNDSDMNILLNV